MIVTDRFVMLNFPKTGSTFVRDVLKDIAARDERKRRRFLGFYKPTFKEFQVLKLPNIRARNERYGVPDEHGIYDQIPHVHRHKEAVSVIRDPFERLVSGFYYGDWKRNLVLPKEELKGYFPHFPDLEFKEYLELMYDIEMPYRYPEIPTETDIGGLSAFFLKFFSSGHERTLKDLQPHVIEEGMYRDFFPSLRFLHTEQLNKELYEFLVEKGYRRDRLTSILSKQKSNRSVPGKAHKDHFDEEMTEKVLWKERMLFDLFPEYKPHEAVESA